MIIHITHVLQTDNQQTTREPQTKTSSTEEGTPQLQPSTCARHETPQHTNNIQTYVNLQNMLIYICNHLEATSL